jgi:dihydroneopterin aldolase
MSKLFLTGISCEGRHGANPGEKDSPQRFVVDLDLDVGTDADSIDRTADYREIVALVRSVVAEGSFDLLETLADEIAKRAVHLERVARARVVVHKPNAARSLGIDGVAAAAEAPR